MLRLEPQFKENIWGGTRLQTEYGYAVPGSHTGECWGICAHPCGDALIKEGIFAGSRLSELWQGHRELFGNLPMEQFPLLVKIIDANQDLSIQVHPDDAYAAANENGSLGKTECWYILDCPQHATLVVGHNARTREELAEMIHQGQFDRLIRRIPIQKGDFIQIEPGTVHAITAGCLLLETQQSSDVTYRVYDYGRLSGTKPRQLHIKQSIDVITVPAKSAGDSVKHLSGLAENMWHEVETCPYYRVFLLKLDGELLLEQRYPFLNISVTQGSGMLDGHPLKKGDHIILPAEYGKAQLSGTMEWVASTVGTSYGKHFSNTL